MATQQEPYPSAVAAKTMCSVAIIVSCTCHIDELPGQHEAALFANEMITAFASEMNFCQPATCESSPIVSGSFTAMYCHGCVLFVEGASRAASSI